MMGNDQDSRGKYKEDAGAPLLSETKSEQPSKRSQQKQEHRQARARSGNGEKDHAHRTDAGEARKFAR